MSVQLYKKQCFIWWHLRWQKCPTSVSDSRNYTFERLMKLTQIKNSIAGVNLSGCDRWPPYWPTGRLADNQKLRILTDNLSKMSNKTYSKAVIGQFKTLFRKRTNIPQFFRQLVLRTSIRGRTVFYRIWPCLAGHGHASAARGTWYESITTELLIYGPIMDLYYQMW